MNSCGTATTGAYFQSGHKDASTSALDGSSIGFLRAGVFSTTLLSLRAPRFMGSLPAMVSHQHMARPSFPRAVHQILDAISSRLVPESGGDPWSSTRMDPRTLARFSFLIRGKCEYSLRQN